MMTQQGFMAGVGGTFKAGETLMVREQAVMLAAAGRVGGFLLEVASHGSGSIPVMTSLSVCPSGHMDRPG